MISTKGKKVEERVDSQYLNVGINCLSIEGVEIVDAKSSSTRQIKLEVKDAKGNTGKVALGSYIDFADDAKIGTTVLSLALIADAVGKRTQSDAIEAETLEDYVKKFVEIVKGIPAWYAVKGREYNGVIYTDSLIQYQDKDTKSWLVKVEAEKSMTSIDKDEEGRIIKLKYKRENGTTGTMVWNAKSKYDLELQEKKADIQPDEDLGGMQGEEADF